LGVFTVGPRHPSLPLRHCWRFSWSKSDNQWMNAANRRNRWRSVSSCSRALENLSINMKMWEITVGLKIERVYSQ